MTQVYTVLRVLAIPVRGHVGLSRLTLDLDHLRCREGRIPAGDLLCSGSQLSTGILGKTGVSDVRPLALHGYGRRCARHEKAPPADTEADARAKMVVCLVENKFITFK
jgi:hypothetical protein